LARLEDVSESSVLQTVRALLRASLLHELDECLVVGDQRPFYPHKGDPTDQNPFILERDF
jgi:uncharacterized protein YpiB (UPF0302 family)